MRFLAGMGITQANEVTPDHLRLWLVHLQETGHNPGGTHAFFRAMKAFFNWLHREGEIAHNPVARLQPPKVGHELLQWKNHKKESFIKPPNAYTGPAALITYPVRKPDLLGVLLDLVGIALIGFGVVSVLRQFPFSNLWSTGP